MCWLDKGACRWMVRWGLATLKCLNTTIFNQNLYGNSHCLCLLRHLACIVILHHMSVWIHRWKAWEMALLVHTLRDHRDDVNGCALSATLLATCSGDKTIRVYSLSDFCELPFSPLSGHGYGVHSCCFSSCGKYLATCSTDATVIIWDMDTGEIFLKYEHPDRSPVRVCALAPDTSLVLSGASDGTVALWDFLSATLRRWPHGILILSC